MIKDRIDIIIERSHAACPELGTDATRIVGRALRLGALFDQHLSKVLARHNMNLPTYRVLAALRRTESPHQLTPSQLLDALLVTSGGMTNLLTRIEAQGYIRRRPHPRDRRGVLVQLTVLGKSRIDKLLPVYVAAEHSLLVGLQDKEKDRLSRLLRKLMLASENP